MAALLGTTAVAQQQPTDPNRPATIPTTPTASTSSLHRADREFLLQAAKLGLEEVRLSQLAAANATDAQAKAYAQTLVTDHQMLNRGLVELARREGVMLPLDDTATGGDGARTRMGSAPGSTPAPSTPGTSSTPGAGAGTTRTAMLDDAEEARELTAHRARIEERVRELTEKRGPDFDRAYLDLMIKGHEDTIKIFESAADRNSDPDIARFANQHLARLREHLNTARQLERQLRG